MFSPHQSLPNRLPSLLVLKNVDCLIFVLNGLESRCVAVWMPKFISFSRRLCNGHGVSDLSSLSELSDN